MDLSLQGLLESMGVPARAVLLTMVLMLFWCIYVGIERSIFFISSRGRKGNLNALAEGTPATVAPLAAPTQAPRR